MSSQAPTPPSEYGMQPGDSSESAEDVLAVENADGTPKRFSVHSSYIWMTAITVAIPVALGIIFIFALPILTDPEVAGRTNLPTEAVYSLSLIGFVLIVGISVGMTFWSYKHIWYEFTEREFGFYSGIFNKKRVHIPYARVQSVNHNATLIQRIVGVCTVSIDTAGGSANKEVSIPYVTTVAAEQIRREIFSRRTSQATAAAAAADPSAPADTNILDDVAAVTDDFRGIFGGDSLDTGTVSYEVGLSTKELLLSGASSPASLVMIYIAVVVVVASALLVPIVSTFTQGTALPPDVASFLLSDVPLIMGTVVFGLLNAALLLWVLTIVGSCLDLGGFRARRRGDRIEVEHGLLSHRFHGVDIDRVQSVIIKQSFIRRILGYAELSLGRINAAGQGKPNASGSGPESKLGSAGLVIHPFVKVERIPEILEGLAPEMVDFPQESLTLPGRSLRRAITRRAVLKGGGVWLAVAGLILWFVSSAFALPSQALSVIGILSPALIAVGAVVFVIDVIGAVLWFKGSSFAYNAAYLKIVNSGYYTETVCIPRRKIQFGFLRSNPLQRMSHVRTINAMSAAGFGGSTIRLIDVCEDDAETWLSWVEPRARG